MNEIVSNVLLFICGLAFTLFGMNAMSSGLERMGGGKLERALSRATDTRSGKPIVGRLKGMAVGCGVTALVQSSSATTVMTVGFVNSGIIKLEQAVGIIMGANIGTTITTWILALAGLSGSAWYVQIFKPMTFSPVLAAIGVALLIFSRRQRRKDVGTVLVSFAVLMFGMNMMSDVCGQLAGNDIVAQVFATLENPILGLLVGALFTGVIQASAATLAIVQALAASGSISYAAAIPIILGSNIGTCVTALISCIGAGSNAKRTAMVHLYFNIIGSLLFMSAFYLADAMFDFGFMSQPLNAANIALVHTIFNVSATALLLPFGGILAKLARKTVKDKPNPLEASFARLDERFLNTPAYAIEQCDFVAGAMADITRDTLMDTLRLTETFSQSGFDKVMECEDHVDHYEDKLGAYLVKICAKRLDESESRKANLLLRSIGNFERISDHCVNLAQSAAELNQKGMGFSEAAGNELRIICAALCEVVDMSFTAWRNSDPVLATKVEPLEQLIDELHQALRDGHFARLQRGECTIVQGFVFTDMLTNVERISDHCSNIAIDVIEFASDELSVHGYSANAKTSPEYQAAVMAYREKYSLNQ